MKESVPMEQTNVTKFPRPAFVMSIDKLDSYEGRKAIARLMRNWERSSKENTFKLLARRATLSPTTVSKIASETTVYPRIHTVLRIMFALGFSMVRFE